jgi:hypothetical protein
VHLDASKEEATTLRETLSRVERQHAIEASKLKQEQRRLQTQVEAPRIVLDAIAHAAQRSLESGG